MISIIVPVYNVLRYVEKCAVSLFEQTFADIEYIFVDDCSTDGSIDVIKKVLQKYPHRRKNVKIIHHDINKGLPSARNTGMRNATGDYVFHWDSDDWADKGMIEDMYLHALKDGADILWCDCYLTFNENERYMTQPEYATQIDALKGLLNGTLKYNVWNKLVKRSLYVDNDIWFPDGYGMGEDMTMIKLFACAKQIAYLKKAFYHYIRTNNNSYTNTLSNNQIIDIVHNTDATVSYINKVYGNKLAMELHFFKLNVKYPFLISDKKQCYDIWLNLFPESNEFILENKYLSIRSRIIQYSANYNLFWIVRLHFKIVHKIIYGILYR